MIVIGNGETRSCIDLARTTDSLVGCNAIARDRYVDHLVCVDRKMVKECIELHHTNFDKIYTRSDWKNFFKDPKVYPVPCLPYTGDQRWDDPFHWGSGPYAVLLAAGLSNIVEMIGFDLWSQTKFVNNCYKDTENYNSSNKRAVDPRYWIHQIGRAFECFPQTQFTIYQTPDWCLPEKWNCTNVQVDKISNFTYN